MSSGAPIEVGTPIRYPSAALLCVSTDDGFQYTKDTGDLIIGPNPANLTINKGRTLLPGKFTRLALTEAQIEWNIPNVNSNNNTLTIELQDVSGAGLAIVRIAIPENFYSPAELIAAIQDTINMNTTIVAEFTALGLVAPVYFEVKILNGDGSIAIEVPGSPSSTATAKTPKISINLTTPAQAVARFNIISCQCDPSITLLPKLNDDLTSMLGITPTTFGSKSYTSMVGGYASFQYTPYIDLISLTLTKNQKVTDVDSSDHPIGHKLARIYLANEGIQPFFASATYDSDGDLIASDDNVIGSAPFTFRREFKFPKQISWNTEQYVDYIELQLLDYKGQYLPINFAGSEFKDAQVSELYLPDLAEYRFTLQVSEQ